MFLAKSHESDQGISGITATQGIMRVAEKNAGNLLSLGSGFLKLGLVLVEDIHTERIYAMAWHLYDLCIDAKAKGW